MLLEIDNLTKHFGGLAAVDGLSFGVGQGEIVGLIGLPGMIKRLFARRANDEAGRAHHAS